MTRRVTNVYGAYNVCAESYGSHKWYAVTAGAEPHPMNAVWVAMTAERITELAALGVHSDGCVRFFRTKRDLVIALNGGAR